MALALNNLQRLNSHYTKKPNQNIDGHLAFSIRRRYVVDIFSQAKEKIQFYCWILSTDLAQSRMRYNERTDRTTLFLC